MALRWTNFDLAFSSTQIHHVDEVGVPNLCVQINSHCFCFHRSQIGSPILGTILQIQIATENTDSFRCCVSNAHSPRSGLAGDDAMESEEMLAMLYSMAIMR